MNQVCLERFLPSIKMRCGDKVAKLKVGEGNEFEER